MQFSTFFPYDLLPWQWVAWIALGLIIGLTKAGFGGLTVVIFPVIATIFGARESTGITLILLLFGDILAVMYYRSSAEWKCLVRFIPWTLVGFAVALFVDKLVPVQAFSYLMGACIIASLVVMIWNEYIIAGNKKNEAPSAWWFSALLGIAGGFASLIGNISGGITAIFLLSMKLPKKTYVGTASWYFLIVNCLKLLIQIFVWKNITVQTLLFDLTLFPVVIAGAVVGIFLIKKISESFFRKTIMLLTLISSVLLFI